jgi:ribose 5-phosphate isomerase B
MPQRVAIGSDHAGRSLRLHLMAQLRARGLTVVDLGCADTTPHNYPDFAEAVGRHIQAHTGDMGLLVCGTGIGMSMAANRLRGIRAALCTDPYMARLARSHNDANVLCLGERVVGQGLAADIVDAFLATDFSGGRHAGRIDQLAALEEIR